MHSTMILSVKQIEAVAYELAERFYKRVGYTHSMQDIDDLSDEFSVAIHKFISEYDAGKAFGSTPAEQPSVPTA